MAQVISHSGGSMAARAEGGARLMDALQPGGDGEIDVRRSGLLEKDVALQQCGVAMRTLQGRPNAGRPSSVGAV